MFNFTLDEQEAVGIITLIGKQPTETGFFPLHQKLVAQFNQQAQKLAEQKQQPGEPE